tara:strand:- start:1925 stop:2383 length:459 start_codon:yes stop_codon:yes gene_type:complete
MSEVHPFDIQVADSISKPPRKLVVPDHRESIGLVGDGDDRYSLGEFELLQMLGYDAGVIVSDDFSEKAEHVIRNVVATRAFGPDWYATHTFDRDAWLSGDVFAYGMVDPLSFVDPSGDDEDNGTHVDTDIHQWLMGADVASGEFFELDEVAV